ALPALRRAYQGRSRFRAPRFQEGGFKTGADLMTPFLRSASRRGAKRVDSRRRSRRARAPRIGLYQPWTGNIDEGWTRWLFEQYGISYTTLHDRDIRKGGLRQRFDVIVLPDADGSSILRGIDSTRIPVQYAGGLAEAGG